MKDGEVVAELPLRGRCRECCLADGRKNPANPLLLEPLQMPDSGGGRLEADHLRAARVQNVLVSSLRRDRQAGLAIVLSPLSATEIACE